MNMPFYRKIYQPFASPPINQFFDDDHLLPRRARIRNKISKLTNLKGRSRSFSAQPPTSRKIQQSFNISYKIHDGFTSDEEIIIKNALQIVANRLVKPEILQNMYDICGTTGVDLGPGVWFHSQLENDRNYDGPHDLLRYQLMCLRVKGEKHKFPTIHIYRIYEPTETRGASDESGSDPVFWAGVIVHEMLHNLGHDHNGEDYNNNWQINVFQKSFNRNGKYST